MKYGFLVSDTAGHYRAIGDLVNMAPEDRSREEQTHLLANCRISQRFINKKIHLKYKVIASIVFSWDLRSFIH